MSLPERVVFSVKVADQETRYLSFTGPQRQLRCGNEDGVFSVTANFVVERAADGLVHIRSCLENCYWARASRFEPWLLASALKSVEDMSDDGCTLFRPRMSAGNVFVGFVHVQSGLNVVMRPATDAHAYNLCIEQGAPTDFSYVDYAPLTRTKLPRYITFLGDNNMYLSTFVEQPFAFLHYNEFDSPRDRAVVFEVKYAKSGDILVKSILYPGFWGQYDSTSRVSIDLGDNSQNYLFEVVFSSPPNTDEKGVALRCRPYEGYDLICMRRTTGNTFILGVGSPDVPSAWIRPRPAAHQDRRRVNIESFRHAWLAPKSTQFFLGRRLSNTSDTAYEHIIPIRDFRHYTKTTFTNSIGFFKGPPALFNGRMPFIASSSKLEFPDTETNIEADWGTTEFTTGESKKYEFKVNVPPKMVVIVNLYIIIATYDVPFSYEQVDEFPFGGTVTQHLNDGVLTIESQYDIEPKYEYQPLSRSESDVQGVELVGAPEIFEYKVPEAQGGMKAEVFDEGSDAKDDDPSSESSDQVADAVGGIKLDASDEVNQEC